VQTWEPIEHSVIPSAQLPIALIAVQAVPMPGTLSVVPSQSSS
jgi:hypothetical protein